MLPLRTFFSKSLPFGKNYLPLYHQQLSNRITTMKPTLAHGLTGCLARLILVVVIELLTTAICMKVFGMSEIPTYCANFSVLCVICAFAVYYDDEYNGITPKAKQKQEPQEYSYDNPLCPYCLSINTIVDDEGFCTCFDCGNCWKEGEM